jgi:hypothetical protein
MMFCRVQRGLGWAGLARFNKDRWFLRPLHLNCSQTVDVKWFGTTMAERGLAFWGTSQFDIGGNSARRLQYSQIL